MTKKKDTFDFDSFLDDAQEQMKAGKDLLGKDGVMAPLLKKMMEATLEGELDAHLEDKTAGNRRNGKGRKKVKTSLGQVEISTPRDRDGSFDPQLIPKREGSVLGLDKQILALYARGNSYEDIRSQLVELYGVETSTSAISRVTDQVLPLVQEWRSRPLQAVYPFVWLDAIHYKVREEGRVVSKAVYCVIGVDQEGIKDLLGMYIGASESSRFWLQVLTDLQNRGVEDIFIACIDNLSGFADAIESIFPKTEVQLCVIHQIRNSLKYIAWKDYRTFLKELKPVYRANNEQGALAALDKLEQNWGEKYPMVIKSWRTNWPRLANYFKYPAPIRRTIYTTNVIEGFHRQLRKVTKTKGAFVSDDALIKLLYLAQERITAKWKRPLYYWKETLAQLYIIFDDRLRLDK